MIGDSDWAGSPWQMEVTRRGMSVGGAWPPRQDVKVGLSPWEGRELVDGLGSPWEG
jgi:hypothetical protein